ncbi:BLOC-1-related complex subunit 7 isoform X2 [Cuculus canorus]|uniref:BLOC-1-related complex subunit 7 isoform X2 n=1 Tax=Cuculus canorus TaxID=55661 RepID=UPI0023AA263C|nr:BLOC-1-related complex subunit 7 isoform X2 [Cuculus canorus]
MSGRRCPGEATGGQDSHGDTIPAAPAPSRLFCPPALAVAAAAGYVGRARGKMAAGGAADAQARFGHSVKGLLTEKVTSCGTDVIALTKQVLKGSRSAELLGQAARNMVMQEDAILHSEDSLRKMAIITTHLQYQQEAIQKK